MSKVSLEELMAQAQQGDNKAYAKLLQEITPIIQKFISKKLSHNEDAHDVTQEVLISVHKASKTYDPSRPFKTWLFAIARYRLNDYLRAYYNKKEKGTDVSLEDEEYHLFDEKDVTDGYETTEYITKALDTLPKKQQVILRLLKIEGYSARETAIKMGMGESAVKVSAHRAMKELTEKFQKDAV